MIIDKIPDTRPYRILSTMNGPLMKFVLAPSSRIMVSSSLRLKMAICIVLNIINIDIIAKMIIPAIPACLKKLVALVILSIACFLSPE